MKSLENKMESLRKKARANFKIYDRTRNSACYRLGEMQSDQAQSIKKFLEWQENQERNITHQLEKVEEWNTYLKNKK